MSVIDAEIARFDRLSATWWNAAGPMRPLHVTNGLRGGYLLERIAGHFGRDAEAALHGLRVLDAGCGAGLVCDPLAALRPGERFDVVLLLEVVVHRASWSRDTPVNCIATFSRTG